MRSWSPKEARKVLARTGWPHRVGTSHTQWYLPTGEVLGISHKGKEFTREQIKKLEKALEKLK